jgi:hypothetical protein
MSLRLCSVFSIALIISSFLFGAVYAAGDVQTRIGNETIERVRPVNQISCLQAGLK